ncbi:polysaccharide biosynthesis tyrosine autokinase [Pleurocapsales cyanobacterium LEGE 10410]|nr:polysaccharide biosynthesis tyrosine autokinase [Pleurocapsales cyanobacterium LEGE 10410]
MIQSNWDLEAQNELGYGQLFTKLWQRRFWFGGVFCGVLAIAVPLSLMKKPVYMSYMQVLAESNYQGKETRGSGYGNEYLERQFADAGVELDYATQLKVLQSSEILRKVINQLDLEESDRTTTEIIEELRKAITVSQLTDEESGSRDAVETNIIEATYTGDDPLETKRVLEVIQEVYLQYNLEQQEKRLRDGLTFIDQQIPKARMQLTQADAALTRLIKENNIVSPEEEAIAIKENIRQIAQERKSIAAQQRQITGNSNTLQQQLGLSVENAQAISRLSQSPRYQNLLNELQNVEMQIAAAKARFTDDNPALQNLLNRRDSQKDLLLQEAERILGTLPPNFVNELESLQKQGQLVGSDNEIASALSQSQAELSGISERELSLAQTEAELKQKLAEFPDLISQYRDLSQEAKVKREALQRLLEARQELQIELNRGGFGWQVIEPPQLGIQTEPNLSKDLLVSLVVASFLGAAAAFAREALDDSISDPKEIERQTTLPVLGITPGLQLPPNNLLPVPFLSSSEPTNLTQEVIEWQPFREAIDMIYENLKLSHFSSSLVDSSLKSLMVTSTIAGEGKSTFILGLALSVARHQQRVLVIDADLRRPSLHQPFNLDNTSGLANFLANETDYPNIEQVSFSGETFDLVTSGYQPRDPVKLLNSPRLEEFIKQQRENYDLVLVDTPPAMGAVDAIKIASICDNSLLVMRLNKVKTSELLKATALFSKLNVIGIVANDSKEVIQIYEAQSKYLLPQQA